MLIISELNEALVEAGATPEKARAAAQAVADFSKDISDIKKDLAVIKWGIALVIAVTVIPFLKTVVA